MIQSEAQACPGQISFQESKNRKEKNIFCINSLFYDDYHDHTLPFEYQIIFCIIVLRIPGENNCHKNNNVMQKII